MANVLLKNKIKELLKQRNMTQQDLAKKTNLNQTQISRICNDYGHSINKKHLAEIALALDVENPNEILQFVEVTQKSPSFEDE